MSYLKILQDRIQQISEDLSSALSIDVTVVDENFIRIGGTGKYAYEINKCCPENSLFHRVLETGNMEINIENIKGDKCKNCSSYKSCKETGNMACPIKIDDNVVGVIGFIAFDMNQRKLMEQKYIEYQKMLKRAALIIENELMNMKITNRLNIEMAEINEIINSINKGIIIINSEEKITHINSKAIKILGINFSKDRIIGKSIKSIVNNLDIADTQNKELIDTWNVTEKNVKVIYQIKELMLNKQKISTLIGFDEIKEIINIAMNYTKSDNIDFSCIIGNSKSLTKVVEKAKIAAKSDSTILLQGDSGTGKELFARAIHAESRRKNEAFVAINCASIPENLLESELFGYEKGAFTGASTKGRIGKFELANNGTLFLDEIGDLPLHLQPKLLRVLQDREIIKVGGNTPIKVDVRIICATHRNLEQLVREKGFRKDLFYRLNVIPLYIPPLKDRENDVLICSEYILNKLSIKLGISRKFLSKEVEEKFKTYDWPGNVRELENVLEYAATLSSSSEIRLEDLPEYFYEKSIDNIDCKDVLECSLDESTKEYQRKILKYYIDKYGNSTKGKKQIAKELGISLATLYRKLDDLEL
ncbi:Transcriptional regulator containing PAS, AAA-type ATPase, and DNA-binding Fis domains [Caloramator quimbayensis]|uniref:Transcriptional regulator containing PAS, AAA-type ATPase, and DNA-binding Fis domains n=1 Tax=Caloramator quimbayensis TaxID=1147123 RepID=A0A1T4XKG8_9CLOT|nr:sigma 54-interacting transcriptional regulator [Caloramator quimbayensis]SKA90062.1 Transcriptional regulator containing PAS, AAA-type ATPase, and DNA-binding Fis domains [Caloramator quimbayensis]